MYFIRHIRHTGKHDTFCLVSYMSPRGNSHLSLLIQSTLNLITPWSDKSYLYSKKKNKKKQKKQSNYWVFKLKLFFMLKNCCQNKNLIFLSLWYILSHSCRYLLKVVLNIITLTPCKYLSILSHSWENI